jgi:hypothetical protein
MDQRRQDSDQARQSKQTLKDLNKARAKAQKVLRRANARPADLREAARGLGAVLISTANADGLWQVLSQRSPNGPTSEERQQLRDGVNIDWMAVLKKVGYKPPPPAEIYAEELAEALTRGLDNPEEHISPIRDKIRELGEKLVALAADPDTTPLHLRRWLRIGARVAVSLGIAAGVTALSIALTPVLAPIAGSAAVGYVATALGVSTQVAGEFVVELVKDPVLSFVKETVEHAFNRVGDERAPTDEVAADYEEDKLAVWYIDDLSETTLRGLRAKWINLGGRVENAKSVITETKEFVQDSKRKVLKAWSKANGAPWFNNDVETRFDTLLRELRDLDGLLGEAEPNAAKAVKALGVLAVEIPPAKARLHQDIAPRDPRPELADKMTAQNALIEQLNKDIAANATETKRAQSELTQAKLNLMANGRSVVNGRLSPKPPPSDAEIQMRQNALVDAEATLKVCEQISADLTELVAQAKRRLDELDPPNPGSSPNGDGAAA